MAYITYNYNGYFRADAIKYSVDQAKTCAGVLIDRDKVLTAAHCVISAFNLTLNNESNIINITQNNVLKHRVQLGFKARCNNIKYSTQLVYIKSIIVVIE